MTPSTISIPHHELSWHFIRASGPGGQNVNKVSSAVQLHFNIAASQSLSASVKARLLIIAGNRVNKLGELVISAQRFRSQTANREDALQRLHKMIHRAMQVPKKRLKTRVPQSAKVKGKQQKQQKSLKKQQRAKLRSWD